MKDCPVLPESTRDESNSLLAQMLFEWTAKDLGMPTYVVAKKLDTVTVGQDKTQSDT